MIGDIAIGGTLKYVDDYTGFSGDPDMQKGNYLVLHASAATGATITAQLIGGVDDKKTLDADGLAIFRLEDNAKSVRFEATKDGKTQVKTLNLVSLVLEEE